MTLKDVEKARKEHPNVPIIVHPECVNEVLKQLTLREALQN